MLLNKAGSASCRIFLSLAFFSTGAVFAQDTRAKIEGVVKDSTQAVIVGAQVSLSNDDTGVHAVTTTTTVGQYLFDFVRLNRRQRIELRNKTERLGELFDWSQLVKQYHAAHDLAMERVGAGKIGKFELRMI